MVQIIERKGKNKAIGIEYGEKRNEKDETSQISISREERHGAPV